MSIDALISDLIKREGGYVNDPLDAGGATIWGITERVARANGYIGDMRKMPQPTASAIYKNEYFIKPGFSGVVAVFPELGEKLFDMGVNMGTSVSSQALQRCLTAINNNGKDYPDLKVDGNIGPVTISALKAFLAKRSGDMGRRTLLFMVAAIQSVRYLELAESSPSQEKYLWGWESQRAIYNAVL